MKAILITRCGCRRDIQVTYPAPPDILVALSVDGTNLTWFGGLPEDPTDPVQTRRFLRNEGPMPVPSGTAYYYYEE